VLNLHFSPINLVSACFFPRTKPFPQFHTLNKNIVNRIGLKQTPEMCWIKCLITPKKQQRIKYSSECCLHPTAAGAWHPLHPLLLHCRNSSAFNKGSRVRSLLGNETMPGNIYSSNIHIVKLLAELLAHTSKQLPKTVWRSGSGAPLAEKNVCRQAGQCLSSTSSG